MSKYELDGYEPLRPWQRLVCYIDFIAIFVAAKILIFPGAPVLRTVVFTGAMILTFSCALLAYWDARVTAHLKRKARQRKRRQVAATRQVVYRPVYPVFAVQGGAEWHYFDDKAPTSS
ncbi:MAG TPA: hypothetical protein VGE34_00825 [Candidatus Saccharimonadales bacterium]